MKKSIEETAEEIVSKMSEKELKEAAKIGVILAMRLVMDIIIKMQKGGEK